MRETALIDLRTRKTLERIREAFRELAGREDYKKITVSALCAEAKIGRKTFYVYYESLDALLEETLEEMVKAYIARINHYTVPENIAEITREFYLFSLEQGKFYDNLVLGDHGSAIGARLLMRFVRDTWEKSSWCRALREDDREIILCFIYNTGAGLYRQWVMSGKKLSLK